MRSLSERQWERYFELLERLEKMPAEQRRLAILDYRANGEPADILSLLHVRLGLAPERDRLRTGERIRNFILHEPLGRGGMGVIYRATQEFTNGIERQVAIKLIHPELIADSPEEARNRFESEIAALVKLEHKGIARIYDGGIHQDGARREEILFFAMELVPGMPLNEYVAQRRASLGVCGVLRIFRRVCAALEYVHQQGIIHRDLKPSNILVDANAEPRIIDFGLAQYEGKKYVQSALAGQSGTPGYKSPEQDSGNPQPITAASDVYALGVILHELLCGRRPYNQNGRRPESHSFTVAVDAGDYEEWSTCLEDCGPEGRVYLTRTVTQAMAFRPADRYTSVTALRIALEDCLELLQKQKQIHVGCRERLINKVDACWIDGLLKSSLHQTARLELSLIQIPNAISQLWDSIVQIPGQGSSTLPPGWRADQVFRDTGEAMLILGAPGAGKTTLLLELAQALLTRAKRDGSQPVPVVFHLSAWAELQRPLAQWLAGELQKRYELPLFAARSFLSCNQLVLLLDGLDEVAPSLRDRCAEAINRFRRESPLTPLVVCSRTAEYAELSRSLQLSGALLIESLTRQKVVAYLDRAGASLEDLRVALNRDEQLWDLLKTPLMLNVAVRLNQRCPGAVVPPAATLDERRLLLFEAYIEAVFKRRCGVTPYSREQTIHWLAWLARSMREHHQSVFYLEWMQPDWLQRPVQRWMVSVGSVILCGLLASAVVGLNLGQDGNFAANFSLALGMGVGGSFVIAQFGFGDRIMPVTELHWSWVVMREGFARKLALAAGCGLLVSVGVAVIFDTQIGLAIGLATFFAVCYFGGMDVYREPMDRARFAVSNDAIRQSLRHALAGGLVGAITGAVISGLANGWSGGIAFGAALFGLIVALVLGGHSCLQHLILRWMLWRDGNAPWRYKRFLDHAAERILLHRVGGGYAFIHRSLLEYFADKHSTPEGRKSNGRCSDLGSDVSL